MSAGGREAVLVPEQCTEVGSVVIGRRDEASIHVGVAARLIAEQFSQTLDTCVAGGIDPPLCHCLAWQVHRRVGHDPERFPRRVVVGCTRNYFSHSAHPAETVTISRRKFTGK